MMNKKRFLALLLAGAVMASLGACGKDEEPEQKDEQKEPEQQEVQLQTFPSDDVEGTVLKWNMGAMPEELDPAYATKTAAHTILLNTMEGLYRSVEEGVRPAMAAGEPERAEGEDGSVTYTFTIREASWSDGQPVTAQDFVYGWSRACDPEGAGAYAYLFDVMTDGAGALAAEAVDEKTLKLTLQEDVASLEQLLSLPAFLPVREDAGEIWQGLPSVGNGPFVLEEFSDNDVLLMKNGSYWNNEEVALDYISGRVYDNVENLSNAWNAGQVDLIVSGLEPENGIGWDQNAVEYVLVNFNTENAALQNGKVRLALSKAIDRTRFQGRAAVGVVPYTVETASGGLFRDAMDETVLVAEGDLEGAKALMTESEVSTLELEIITNSSDRHAAAARELADQWAELGVVLTVTPLDDAEYAEALAARTYKDLALGALAGSAADPMEFLGSFAAGSLRSSCGYTSLDYDKLLAAALAAGDQERAQAWQDAESFLMEDAYVMPLSFNRTWTLENSRLTNCFLTDTGSLWFGDAAVE